MLKTIMQKIDTQNDKIEHNNRLLLKTTGSTSQKESEGGREGEKKTG